MYTYEIAYGPALSDLLCVFRPNEWGSRVEVRRVLYPAYSTHDTLAQDAELNTNAELLSLWKHVQPHYTCWHQHFRLKHTNNSRAHTRARTHMVICASLPLQQSFVGVSMLTPNNTLICFR